jgi:transcriptional regulator with XRE-family HTH domain
MTIEDAKRLGEALRDNRYRLDLSAREVARRAHLDVGTVTRLEQGISTDPRPSNVVAVARVVGLSEQDLGSYTGWYARRELPTFTPYLRSKYGGELPPEAINELETFFDYLRSKHGLDGPIAGEDER